MRNTRRILSFFQDGFERKLFEAALKNLADLRNPLRFNNFAYATREAVRHVLKRLAPDQNVLQCSWYRQEPRGKRNEITRRQRAYFAVQGGLADDFVKETLGLETDDIHRSLVKAIDALSRYTHVEPATFAVPRITVDALVEQTLTAVEELFDTIHECRKKIIECLSERIDSEILNETLRDTIQEIDELATHHYIDEIDVSDVVVTAIDHDVVRFGVSGSISCALQWGSGSDVARGDGVRFGQSFPFTCALSCSTEEPDLLQCEDGSLEVDTTRWHFPERRTSSPPKLRSA